MESLSIAFAPGVTPGKWLSRWRERHPDVPIDAFPCDVGAQLEMLHSGRADMAFVRLPVEDESLHVIPLYSEQPVVVGPKDHEISVFDEVELDSLDDPFLDPDAMGGEAMAVEVAASGAGLVILPMSVARLHNRKDVVFRPVTGVEESRIGLAWLAANTSELTEEFVGIVRGRTANSSRQPSARSEAAGALKPDGTTPTTAGGSARAQGSGKGGGSKTGSKAGRTSGGRSGGANSSGRSSGGRGKGSAGRNRRRGGGR
ncbi:LysR family substrate-binding domain-containing protein [Arthrobacter sp. H14]|uniref:LysR family substrate-binding domain-containing protein n=1 Tax=Arthrobacter sp. H14 TaxID=1312959 RepID=UPI0004B7001B|nr:LysR family substrate-binding domain-containing protein [Arthrobacter sp. H14]